MDTDQIVAEEKLYRTINEQFFKDEDVIINTRSEIIDTESETILMNTVLLQKKREELHHTSFELALAVKSLKSVYDRLNVYDADLQKAIKDRYAEKVTERYINNPYGSALAAPTVSQATHEDEVAERYVTLIVKCRKNIKLLENTAHRNNTLLVDLKEIMKYLNNTINHDLLDSIKVQILRAIEI